MTATEVYEMIETAVLAIRTDESRFEDKSLQARFGMALSKARELWVNQNGGIVPSLWLLTEVLEYRCAEEWNQFDAEFGCMLAFKIPSFINIKGTTALSISTNGGRPFNYIANSKSEFEDWAHNPFFKTQEIGYIEEGILHIKTKAKVHGTDVISLTGIPYDPEDLSTFNPMWDEYPATPDVVQMALDIMIKPLVYMGRPIDTVSNSKDSQNKN